MVFYFYWIGGFSIMTVFRTKQVSKEWNGRTLFHSVNLEITEGEHVALFGRNGIGKSTLLRCLMGETPFTSGEIQRFIPIHDWGILHQSSLEKEQTGWEYMLSSCPEHFRLYSQIMDAERNQHWNLLTQYIDQYTMIDGYQWELFAERCLAKVGLTKTRVIVPLQNLSGGEKTRIQIARLLLKEAKFLILDEPTNHLDQETLIWLEQWIQSFPGAVLLVSHDRHFIDQVAHSIYELREDGGSYYTGRYTDYHQQKLIEKRTQETLYQKQEQQRKKLEECIRRYQTWFHKAHQSAGQNDFLRAKSKKNVSRFKAKEQALSRLESEMVSKSKNTQAMNISFQNQAFEAQTFIRAEQVGMINSQSSPLFSDVHLHVKRGDRIAIIGPNGAGKSTLLKILTKQIEPSTGEVWIHPSAEIGYFEQGLDSLSSNETLLGHLLQIPGMTNTDARTILGSFQFRAEEVDKKIEDLSMGERCRLAFLLLVLSHANLLVLDEPTNYLDLSTREKIEDVLSSYPGTVILVSHDRYLLRKVSNKVIHIQDGSCTIWPMGYEQYTEHQQFQKTRIGSIELENQAYMLQLRMTQLASQDASILTEEAKETLLSEMKEVMEALVKIENQTR